MIWVLMMLELWFSAACIRLTSCAVADRDAASSDLHPSLPNVRCVFRCAARTYRMAAPHPGAVAYSKPMTGTIKSRFKDRLKSSRHLYARTFHSFTPEDLFRQLHELAYALGTWFSSTAPSTRSKDFGAKPTDVIAALEQAVGPAGTLLMPTLPFGGLAVELCEERIQFSTRFGPRRGWVSSPSCSVVRLV